MPKELEAQLKREAKKKFPGDKKRQDRYTYGTLHDLGFRTKREKKSK